jgi:uncharacterized protein
MVKLFSVCMHDIPPEGVRLVTQWEPDTLEELLEDVAQVERVGAPLQLDVSLVRAGSNVVLQGALHAEVWMVCVRCLEACSVTLEAPFRYIFLPQAHASAAHDREELRQDELEIVCLSGEVIELRPLVREQIVLCLPQYPRCSETCPGICPQCGLHLKESSCACAAGADSPKSPFGILKHLKHKQ